jgi:hypothetical protein
MARLLWGIVVVWLLGVPSLTAAQIKGKLKKVDPDKGTITITADGKERTFTISKDTEISVKDIRDYKPKDGLKDQVFQRKNLDITITTAKKGGKEVVTKLVAMTGRKG